MTRSSRDEVLARVRSSLRGADRTTWDRIPRDYVTERPAPDLVGLFCARVSDYRATVRRVATDEVADAAADALHRSGARRTLVPHGLPQPWCERLESRFDVLRGEPESLIDTSTLDRVDAVVSTAAVGIASTGTIVLDHGPGQGRRADTLVPDVHVCVVSETQVVDDVPAALVRVDPARPLTFISGPSATSDIELDRVEGVHGPRTLHVLVHNG